MSLTQIYHCLNKVVPISAEYPRNANNKIFIQNPRNSKLTFKLRLPIHIHRFVITAVRLPGLRPLPVKHIIRTDIHHWAVKFFTYFSNIAGTFRIHGTNFLYLVIILSQIHCCPCCAVNHSIRSRLMQSRVNCIFVRNIKLMICHGTYSGAILHATVSLRHIRANAFYSALRQFIHHIMSKLSAHACHKDFHVYSSSGHT